MGNNTVLRCDFRMHDIIDGKYRVERVLESSSTMQKFKVNDTAGNEFILVLYKLWEVEPRMRQSMLLSSDSEIKSCLIKSNYLAAIVKTGVVNGNPYLLTQYQKSSDLSQYMRGANKLNLIRTIRGILYGLRDLHKSGKVHCRLTPENISVAHNGHILITNYVILGERGKVITSQNKTLHSRFIDKSLAYQAPELYHIGQCSTLLPTIDIFSFGVILFQLLTRELPFGRLATESDWIHYQSRAKNNDWNKNILLRHNQRDLWISVLEKCLASDVSTRAKNIDEILTLLPDDDEYPYESIPGNQIEVQSNILNGIMLHVMQGDEFGKCYRLQEILQPPRRIITIGRVDESVFNMIQLSEQSSSYISRRHCTLELDDKKNSWYIRDGQWDKHSNEKWIRSLNGTFVNSDLVTEEGHQIVPGDVISIGDVKLRVEAY